MTDVHGLIPHQAGYYFITLEEDYVLMFLADAERWREQATDTPENAKKYAARKAHAVAKAYISSVLEQLSDKQFKQGIPEHKIWVYVSFPEIEARIHGGVKIRVLKDAMKEMDEDGMVSKRPNPDRRWRTKVYQMNFREYRKQLNALPKRVGLIDSAYLHDATPEQEHRADMHDGDADMHDGDADMHDGDADMHPRITNRYNTEITQNKKDDAPAENVIEWHVAAKRITDARLPAVRPTETTSHIASSGYEKDDDEAPTEKRAVINKPLSSEQKPGTTVALATSSRASRPGLGGHTPARRSVLSTSNSPAASANGAAQRGFKITHAPTGKPVTQEKLSMKEDAPVIRQETPAQLLKRQERRRDEILAIYGEELGRKPSRSKENLAGAMLCAQDDVSDEDIRTTIKAILADDFLAKNLSVAFVYKKLDALARKSIPKPGKNGKAPSGPDAYGNDYSLTAQLARQQKAM